MAPTLNLTPGKKLTAANMPPELRAILDEVRKKFDVCDRVHRPHRDKWREYYDLYRSYRRLKTASRDKDGAVLLTAKREWGAELFIPYVFATIETIVPRVLSNDPKMLVLPRNINARESALRVQELLNVQQAQIDYDLKLQPTARRGLMFGLGVQKTFWDRRVRKVMRTVPSIVPGQFAAREQEVVLFEGPQVEDVDPRDFFWSPEAHNIETASYVIHRTWRSYEYIKQKVESGQWLPIDLEDVRGKGNDVDLAERRAEQMEAAGLYHYDPTQGGHLHEVWEYHDRENVYTILDKRLVVQVEATPFYHRELPFQIYRPTPVPGEFVGIGEVEPIVHLQYELNTLRSQRRDNATMVLQKAIAYSNGLVDPDHLVVGPGVQIPVQGDPRAAIFPLEVGEIPASSYREEDSLKQDIERTSGMSDAIMGGEGAGTAGTETATGIQLIQQAANVRIRLKTKNLERETVRPAARQFLELNRQHLLAPQQVRVDDPNEPEGFRFTEVGPEHLLSDIDDPIPEAGSTEPDNPALRQDSAMRLFNQLTTNPMVDQRRLAIHLLREHDVRDAESFLIPETPQVDPRLMGQVFAQLGVPEELVEQGVMLTLQAQQDADAAERGESPSMEPSEPEE